MAYFFVIPCPGPHFFVAGTAWVAAVWQAVPDAVAVAAAAVAAEPAEVAVLAAVGLLAAG